MLNMQAALTSNCREACKDDCGRWSVSSTCIWMAESVRSRGNGIGLRKIEFLRFLAIPCHKLGCYSLIFDKRRTAKQLLKSVCEVRVKHSWNLCHQLSKLQISLYFLDFIGLLQLDCSSTFNKSRIYGTAGWFYCRQMIWWPVLLYTMTRKTLPESSVQK